MTEANQEKNAVKQTVAPVKETETKQQESRKIAVVNLDEGTTEAEEKINYADKIVQFPSSSFEYSSLEEARTGLANGKAYFSVTHQEQCPFRVQTELANDT